MPMEILRHGRITWTDIRRATPDDVEGLRKEYPHFHPLDLEDVLSRIERPKLDEYDDYLFTVMHFPIWDALEKISRPSEVDLFMGTNYLVTIHDGTLLPLTALFERCQEDETAREKYMSYGASYLFHSAIDQLVDYLFPILYKVDANIRRIEEQIFIRDTRWVIREIAFVRRDNIALRRIVRPQIEILEILEETERPFIRDELEVYFGDIRDHLHKAADLITDHKEVIEGLADTANTLANYRTNEIVQILTVISVIMMPLTLLSGIYGMNIALPFQDHP
ncbi:MAG TPA: magnesium transporter CorA family protein, partial [Aggregatilineales bacterium]|nr:magnesium transporter CorA family protein [Aggregatilineales bacterium]